MNVRVSLTVAAGFATASMLITALAGPAAAANGVPPRPADLQVQDLRPDRMTVTWSPVAGAAEYKVAVIPLEPASGYFRTGTRDPVVTLTGLAADVPYKVTVRAFVPSAYANWYSEASEIVATTPLPVGYVFPSAPRNLRVERDSSGTVTLFRWDAPSQSFGPLTYQIHLESVDVAELTGIFGHTSELSLDAEALPIDGGILAPGQSVAIWVTATDRANNLSPASEHIELTCCPL